MRIETTPRFRRCVRGLTQSEKGAIEGVLTAIGAAYGYPHLHSGMGIRHLRRNWFECRAGLDTRLVFWAQKGVLTFYLAGNHNDVRRFLKGV